MKKILIALLVTVSVYGASMVSVGGSILDNHYKGFNVSYNSTTTYRVVDSLEYTKLFDAKFNKYNKCHTYTKDIDLLAYKVKYMFIDGFLAYTGIGYSFQEYVFESDIFVPIGLEYFYEVGHYQVGGSLGLNVDVADSTQSMPVARLFVGYAF